MFRILWAVKLIENFFGTTKTDSALFSEKKKLIVKRLTRIPNPTRAARRLGSRPLAPGARNRAGAGAAAASPALNF
jgi:hypothetical protein